MESGTIIQNWPIFRRTLVVALALFLICGQAALSQGKKNSDTGTKTDANTAAAQQAFAANCAGCHGLDGKGGERAPDIVTRPNTRQLSDPELFQILQNGIPRKAMPAFTHLGEPVLHSLVAYLRTLQGNPLAAALPGNPKQGRELFFGKGECSRCHMVRGEGGFFASDLSSYSRGRSPEAIHQAIVSPNLDLDPRNRAVVVTLHNGKKLEGIARNEDNFSIQLLTPDGALHLLNKSELKSFDYRNESPMPADYATRLSSAELDDLVNYLYSVARKETKGSENQKEPDDD